VNRARVAELLRELADEFAAPEAEAFRPAPKPVKPPPKPRLVRPEGENDEVAAAKARQFLRGNGYTKVSR
jgi:hypothetical protein